MKLHNIEAEKSVLGCLMIDNSLIKKVQLQIIPEYFYSPENRKIFETIVKLYEKYNLVDITTLNEFKFEYLEVLVNSVISASSINHYLQIISDLAIRRQIYMSSEKIKEIALDENIEQIQMVKADALYAINSISLPDGKKSRRKMTDIVADTLIKLENAYLKGENAYYKWNLNWLQDKTGGMKAGYTILAARPSVGKTSLALQLGTGIASQGAKVAIFSLETMEDIVTNTIICNKGGIDNKYFKTPTMLNAEQWGKIGKTAAEISELKIEMFDNVFFIEELVLKSQELIASDGLDLIIIDYIQLLESHKKTTSQNDKISHISRQIKKLQQTNGIQILVLSQFSRESEKKKEPTLSDLRDSGSLEQDATNVWFLHVDSDFVYKEGEPVETQLIIAKQKDGVRNIKKKLKFFGNNQRFYDN